VGGSKVETLIWGAVILGAIWMLSTGGFFGAVTTGAVTPPVVDQDSNCDKLGISENVCGDPATVAFNAYDYAAGTASTATTANASIYNGNVRLRNAADYDITDTTGFATQVGNQLSIYVIDYLGYYYGTQTDKGTGFTTFDIRGTSTADVPVVRIVQTVTNLDSTVYNNSGATALTACGTTTYCDYIMLFGANEENQVIWKLKNSEADSVYDFAGFVMANWNNTLQAQIVGDNYGGTYTAFPCTQNVTSVANLTMANRSEQWDTCVERNEPLRILEYKQLEITLNLKAGATAPTGTGTYYVSDTSNSNNGWCFNALDSAWFTGKSTLPAYGLFTDSETGNNVGMEEVLTSPLGADAGFCLEAG